MVQRGILSVVTVVGLVTIVVGQVNTLTRNRDPVVMVGANLPMLVGLDPNGIVAFCYRGGWQQIPVQIDKRKVVDFGVVYHTTAIGITTLAYADPNTYTGADANSTFDNNDELVFMARDAGDRADGGAGVPAGVLALSSVEVQITDSLDSGTGYVYLFRTDGTLSPGAGRSYVSYAFRLNAGSYIPKYKLTAGPNPENSEAITPYYRTHFSDRWICDEINVYAGGATGVDILDRHKNLFAPGVCTRSEATFSNGEGAFFTNKVGPVRAIRSYMGANSGPYTQREHIFYEQRQDVTTFLRVHSIPGIGDYYDYSPQAAGMLYYDDLNTGGVLIDGIPDTLAAGTIMWEMVTGLQGSLLISLGFQTNISGLSFSSVYDDDSTPPWTQCTGDAYEYGASGVWVLDTIPNTDPSKGTYSTLTSWRTVYYEAPGQSVSAAVLRSNQARTPLGTGASAYHPTHTLALSTVNPMWGQVLLSPEPNDANNPSLLTYAVGTTLTLTAVPTEGRSFGSWTLFDPNHPGDANFATVDANTSTTIVMNSNMQAEATFKCSSGVGLVLPLMAAGLLGLVQVRRRF